MKLYFINMWKIHDPLSYQIDFLDVYFQKGNKLDYLELKNEICMGIIILNFNFRIEFIYGGVRHD
jgi:hypothetical protein